jgi:SAM-dependent methyltransferase
MNTLKTAEQLKQIVKTQYGQIADQSREENAESCCGSTCGCATGEAGIMAEDYSKLDGYAADADLGLGCGLPTAFAQIKEGDTVVDLGSGAGNDCFVARSVAGSTGKIIGVDFTEKMISKARSNAEKLGYSNVEFRYGDVEDMPIANDVADVVVSNCVLNLVPDKRKAFQETFRILKPGGHFSVSDIVLQGELPSHLKQVAEMYTGCVSGAIQKDEYLDIIKAAGFTNIAIQKTKTINIPDGILKEYILEKEIAAFRLSDVQILSVTVYAEKPLNKIGAEKKESCCGPECCK